MTPNEFKAWFDGFTEALTAVPNKGQWERIKARVVEIDGKSVTERVYLDRYLPAYFGSSTSSNVQGLGGAAIGSGGLSQSFDSLNAMAELGRNDAAAIG